MKASNRKSWQLSAAIAAALSMSAGALGADSLPAAVDWSTVVNNQAVVPGTAGKLFNSYNQPSLNDAGYLVFRARSKGPSPMSGIYVRNMLASGALARIADRTSAVPAPNNTTYAPDYTLAKFNEFPSIPRIGRSSQTIATRGSSQPVWTYQVNGADTKAGTTGIFLNPGGALITGIGLLGAVPAPAAPVVGLNYFPYMAVPGVSPTGRFDVFPGSPAMAGGDWIVFKANYTEAAAGKTGVFYRDPIGLGGTQTVKLLANTSTVIPNLPAGISGVTFGSTAPPSADGRRAVFAGFDNEDSPTYGGIYLAPLTPSPALTTMVGIGDPVPGETSETFNRFGEALSFDGRYVAFWGAWGTEQITLWLDCPTDGNVDMLAYCRDHVGDNHPVTVPANQGIFVADTQTATVRRIARTGGDLNDFVYWNFSGKPPGVGGSDEDDDGEPPRWRSTSFVAVSGGPKNTYMAAFKARTGDIDPGQHNYVNPVDGIYLADTSAIATLLDTTMDGQTLDPAAPAGSKISSLGIEREGFRGPWLSVSASMLEPISGASMAGIYLSKMLTWIPLSSTLPGSYVVVPESNTAPIPKTTGFFVSQSGRFTGQLVLGNSAYAVSGKLDESGRATQQVRTTSGPVTMKLASAEISKIRVLDVSVTGVGVNYSKLAVYTK